MKHVFGGALRRAAALATATALLLSLAVGTASAAEVPATPETAVSAETSPALYTTRALDPSQYGVTVTAQTATVQPGDTITLEVTVTKDGQPVTDLAAEQISVTTWADHWNDHTDGNADAVLNNDKTLTPSVTLPSEGTYYLVTEIYDLTSDWAVLTSCTTTITVAAPSVTPDPDTPDPVPADVTVEYVPGLSEDFIMGVDISSAMAEFASGVTYQDFEGNTIDNITDFCKFLAECGVTHVRVRIWNDPYDADGNGYGGGNNDVETAVQIAEGCQAAGLKMLLDFHCSDFWCDPSKQQAPKAWKTFSLEQKADALQTFLTDSLQKIAATGADIDMVQVGNETTGGFIGETDNASVCTLFNAGAAAIRAFDPEIRVVIHITNPEKGRLTQWGKILHDNGVDYDILATSYYPYWHGSFENLQSEMQKVQTTYGKDVMVAETSYAFTLADTDGHDNTVRVGNNDTGMAYPFSVQGQASFLRDLIAAVSEAGGLGVYYWEPAWITVGDTTGLTGDAYNQQVEANKVKWEQYGSGWASSFSAEYDPDDAGVWYGGSAVDNQALFDADGAALPSAEVWKLVYTGSYNENISVDGITMPTLTIEAGDSFTLPAAIDVAYSDGTVAEPVTWNAGEQAAVNPDKAGSYTVSGTVSFSKTVNAGDYAGKTSAPVIFTLTVKAPNLLPEGDATFESVNLGNFATSGNGIKLPSNEDPMEGASCLHWYWASPTASAVNYKTHLEAGHYVFEAPAMGMAGEKVTLNLLDAQGQLLASGTPLELLGYGNWLTASMEFTLDEAADVQLQIALDIQKGGWGSVDNLYLAAAEKPAPEPEPEPSPDTTPAAPATPATRPDTTVTAAGPSATAAPAQPTATPVATVSVPQTSDSANLTLWVVLLVLSGAGLLGCGAARLVRRRR